MNISNKANIAIVWYFYAQGYITGCWAALIPDIKNMHNISDSLFGILLLLAIAGAIIALYISTLVINKYGSGILALIGTIVFSLVTPVIGLPGSIYIFTTGLILLGFCMGLVDVSNNSQAVLLEKYTNKHKLGECHCSYALGGLSGALVSGYLTTTSLSTFYILLCSCLVTLLPTILLYVWLFNFHNEMLINNGYELNQSTDIKSSTSLNNPLITTTEKDSYIESNIDDNNTNNDNNVLNNEITKPSDRILLISLSVLGGLAYFGEGSIGDWSAIYINSTLDGSLFISSLGYVFFQLFVAIGRYSCANLLHYFSSKQLLQLSGFISSLGLGLVVYSPSFYLPIPLAVIGFAVCGSGISIVAPIVISSSGNKIKSMDSNEAIAWVSSLSYIGILLGPPFIGGMTVVVGGLRYSLLLDACLLFLITVVATMTTSL